MVAHCSAAGWNRQRGVFLLRAIGPSSDDVLFVLDATSSMKRVNPTQRESPSWIASWADARFVCSRAGSGSARYKPCIQSPAASAASRRAGQLICRRPGDQGLGLLRLQRLGSGCRCCGTQWDRATFLIWRTFADAAAGPRPLSSRLSSASSAVRGPRRTGRNLSNEQVVARLPPK